MIDWQSMDSAPRDGMEVLIVFREERVFADGSTMMFTVSPGYYDDGVGDEDEPYCEPSWWYFDSHETGEVEPVAWAPYPAFGAVSSTKLGITLVPA